MRLSLAPRSVIFPPNLQSESFSIQTIALFDLVQRMFLKGGFDVVKDVIHVMLFWPPRIEFRSEIESSILLRNQWVKDVGDKMHGRRSVGVIVGEGKTEFQNRVGVVALVDEEDGVPDRWVTD